MGIKALSELDLLVSLVLGTWVDVDDDDDDDESAGLYKSLSNLHLAWSCEVCCAS